MNYKSCNVECLTEVLELMDIDSPERMDVCVPNDNDGWAEDDMARAKLASLDDAYATHEDAYLVEREGGSNTAPVAGPSRLTVPDSPPSWEAPGGRPLTPHPDTLDMVPSPFRLPPPLYPNPLYVAALSESMAPEGPRPQVGNVYTASASTRAQVELQRRGRALAMFTPPPPGGFPSPCLGDPEALFEGLPRHRIASIMNEPEDTVLLIWFFNVGFPRPGQVQGMTEALAMTVNVVTGEVDPLIIQPELDWVPGANARVKPMLWVLMKLRPASTAAMLERNAWSGPAAS